MKVSNSLLKKFLKLDLSPQETAKTLTLAGLEVDAIENEKPCFSNVIAARVEKVEKHPSADKLTIVDIFDGKENFQVVCGAPNVKAGMKTAFANIGAEIEDELGKTFKIKKCKLRQVESYGMLCSAKELKISDEDLGIMDLDDEIEIGANLSEIFLDPVFEISLTPNLGHCMSAIGVARELAALTKTKIQKLSFDLKEMENTNILDEIKISVQNKKLIPRYSARIVKNISKNIKTPFWIKKELLLSGMRPISPIVDIMNYVMLLLGQPLHAFDLDKIDKTIFVKTNEKEQKLKCLDKEIREISKHSIVITDTENILALGGVMGADNSSVDSDTQNILIESASFDPIAIRQTANLLNLRTESAQRFEKEVDPNMTIFALNYATYLIQTICYGDVIKGMIDIKEKEFLEKEILLREKRVNKILGTKLSFTEIESILKRLEFKIKPKDEDSIKVIIPTYRNDISKEIDLIEEIARIYGFNNIKSPNCYYQTSKLTDDPLYLFENRIRTFLLKENLQEVITPDLISPKLCSLMSIWQTQDQFIEIVHSKSIDHSILRPSLLPSFLEVAKTNFDRKNKNLNFFEISKTHIKQKEDFFENSTFAILLTGSKNIDNWAEKFENFDFFDLKGILENLLNSFGIKKYSFNKSDEKIFHPTRQAHIITNGKEIGKTGQVHPAHLKNFDLNSEVYFCEIDIAELYKHTNLALKIEKIKKYPSTERDWTITLDKKFEIDKIFESVNRLETKFLEKFKLIDIFESEKIGKDKINATFKFIFRDLEKTISFDEAEGEFSRITDLISKKLC